MPRLRPAPNEEDQLPQNVEVELEPQDEVVIEADNELASDTDDQRQAKRDAARAYRLQKKEEEDQRLNENADLKKQLEDMRAAVEDSRKQAQIAQQSAQEEQNRASQRERESHQYLSRAEEAEYNSVLTAMAAAENEADSSQRDLEAAQTNGDFKLAAEAQRRLSRAEAKMVQLEEGKTILEQRKNTAIARAEEARRNPPAPRNVTPEQQIDAVNTLLPSQKEWLKAHPDAWTDQRKNLRLQGAHVEAEDKGLQPGTKGYFTYLEERLGYKEAVSDVEEDDEEQPRQRRSERRTLVSAPVSRDNHAPSGKPSRTKITLNPKQQEAAAIAGISQADYARNMLKLQDLKEEGYYNE